MTLVFAALVPHPPLLVPEIGQEKRARVAATVGALERLADTIHQLNPEALLMITPHGPFRRDALTLLKSPIHAEFLHFKLGWDFESDAELGMAVAGELGHDGFRTAPWPSGKHIFSTGLDHALMVPMYFLKRAGVQAPLVCISICAADHRRHHDMGRSVARAVQESKLRVVLVASGDLSHRLLPEAPAGFDPHAHLFDEVVVESLRQQNWQGLLDLDEGLVERAGECGLRPIGMLTGLLQGRDCRGEVLAYEGPFGVGYCTAAFEVRA
ncbi:MAG: AmmeMemoRadiSam system protein B [Candidatus Xenobia bacterium]